MRSIFEIGDQCGTDKRMLDHGYLATYWAWLESMRDKPIKLLEIGLGNGSSARMWREYFPNAEIFIMELADKEYADLWKSPDLHMDGIDIILGDQSLPETWDKVPNDLDVIIDDGSHIPEHQIASVNYGFPKLKLSGLYFIEDTHCNFSSIYSDKDKIYPWVFQLIMQQQIPNRSTNGNFYFNRGLMPEGLTRQIVSYHFYKSMIIMEKTAIP